LTACNDPKRSAFACAGEPQQFSVGRVDRAVNDKPRTGRYGGGIELHQNSDFAATPAAAISGAG
jgi:hypothetical protein